MTTESDFFRFYQQAKRELEKYRCQKDVNQFLMTSFAEVEQSQSLSLLSETLQCFCKQRSAKVNSVGVTAFGGVFASCGCLKKLKALYQEINKLVNPKRKKLVRSRKKLV